MSRPKPSSRVNGRLSKGPKTPEGKARSKRNALRHGLLAQSTLSPSEFGDDLDRVLQQHHQCFLPQNPAESDLVAGMAFAHAQLRRLWSLENLILSQKIEQQPDGDPADRLTAAFSSLVDDGSYQLMQRYEARFHGTYHRATQALLESR